MPDMRLRILHAALLALLFTLPCFGWGREGHTISGAIAWHFLSDKAKAAVDDLLGGQSLGAAGCWADEIRSDRSHDWAKPLHYINVPAALNPSC